MTVNADKLPLILVMGNDEGELAQIEELFNTNGYETETTLDGFEGFQIAITKKPGLIISSLNLKRINGSKVIKLLKFDKKYKSIPVIALVDDEKPETLERIKMLRIDRYVKRPIDNENLLMNVRNLFSESEIGGFIEEALL